MCVCLTVAYHSFLGVVHKRWEICDKSNASSAGKLILMARVRPASVRRTMQPPVVSGHCRDIVKFCLGDGRGCRR